MFEARVFALPHSSLSFFNRAFSESDAFSWWTVGMVAVCLLANMGGLCSPYDFVLRRNERVTLTCTKGEPTVLPWESAKHCEVSRTPEGRDNVGLGYS